MNENGRQEKKQQRLPSIGRSIIVVLFALVVIGYLFPFFNPGQQAQKATLLDIVAAIEAGEVKSLTVRGDNVIAAKFDGTRLGAQKESNISAVESLQIFGITPEALKTVPITVENADSGFLPLFSLLLTFAPLLFIGYLAFRVMRQMQGGGGPFGLGRIGRSNPRVIAGAARCRRL